MARLSVATRRFASAESKHSVMVCSTSGLTHAASISRTRLSILVLSGPCFAGTKTRRNAMFIYQTYRQGSGKPAECLPSLLGSLLLGQVAGSHVAGRFKSFLPQG